MNEYNPVVVCFSCKFGWAYLTDEAQLAPSVENWVPAVCSGKVDTPHILDAFRAGADGVLILGCDAGHCHFQDGNYQMGKKMYLLQKVLQAYGIESERLRIDLSRDPAGSEIPRKVSAMKSDIARLGPVKAI